MPLNPEPLPAKLELVRRRVTQRKAAHVLGVSEQRLSRMLNGFEPMPDRLRSQLAAFLDLPETRLFNDDQATVA